MREIDTHFIARVEEQDSRGGVKKRVGNVALGNKMHDMTTQQAETGRSLINVRLFEFSLFKMPFIYLNRFEITD